MVDCTVAICAYNGAQQLPALVRVLREQPCPVPFEILIVDNNSSDGTADVVAALAQESGPLLRLVSEPQQGIPFARNRAIDSALENRYLAFIDVDEMPGKRWLASAVDALEQEQAQCVGGEIAVHLPGERPRWLSADVMGFLGEVRHADQPFWITSRDTPVWSGNVAYRTELFRRGLRFDTRYNRAGSGVGGGSDGIMFRRLLEQKIRIRYRPDMLIEHHVEAEKIRRSYFLRLHYVAGKKFGLYEMDPPQRAVFGVPPYLIRQFLSQLMKSTKMLIAGDPAALRNGMNASHLLGAIVGQAARERGGNSTQATQ